MLIACRRHAGVGGARVHLDAVVPIDVESHLPAGVPQLHIVGPIDVVCLHLHLLSIHIDGLPGGHRNDTRCRSAAAEKLENGMSGFLTQPLLSAQAVENLKKTRETLGERAKILAGILPVVSQRNAIFMENEVNGIHVDEAIIQKFEGLDRTAGEELGLEVSVQAAKAATPYADGFYLMTPFNRVALMERLMARLRTEVTD